MRKYSQTWPSSPKIRQLRHRISRSVGDPALLPLLEAHHVTVNAKAPSKPWFLTLLVDWGPMLLLVFYFIWMSRKAMSNQSSLFGMGRAKAKRYSSEQPEGDIQ